MAVATPDSYPGTPLVPIYAGKINPDPPDPGGGALVMSYFVDNTSGSAQASGFVTKMKGLPFKAGEMPAGQYPVFKVGGVECPPSIGGISYWPDGSMKRCSVFLIVPTAVAGNGSIQVDVYSGGSAPAASSRALSDFTSADLKVEVTGVSGLSGTWTASLNDAITANTDLVPWTDGPAGKSWRVGGDFKQSAAAHGQLYCQHYVMALSNANGTLKGLRWMPRPCQPWGDVASPAVATRVVTSVVKSGATTLRTMTGHSGSETVGANIGVDQYTSWFGIGGNGECNYVQGGGTDAAETTTRNRFTPASLIRTQQFGAYDAAQSATSNSSVSYVPYCRGHMQRHTPGTGERGDIGLMPEWYVRALLKQTAVDEQAVRVNALAAGGWRIVVRQQASKNVIACVDIQASYTGMGTMRTGWRHWPEAYMTGLQNPASWSSLWEEEFCSHHRAAAFYYAAQLTGEQQYFDMMAEMATVTMLNMEPNAQGWSTTLPITNPVTGGFGERGSTIAGTTYKGAGLLFRQDNYRIPAWGIRDIAHAAAILPDSGTHYTGVKAYCRDVISSCWAAATAYNNAMSADWRAAGLWSLNSRIAVDEAYEGPWGMAYLVNVVCFVSKAVPETGTYFRNHLAKLPAQIHAGGFDVACLASYRLCQWNETARIDKTDEIVCQPRDTTLTPSTSDSFFTISGPNSGWTPTNGDVFMFSTTMNGNKPFSAAVNDRRLYAVNVNTGTKRFQLALTRGGSPITVTSASAISLFAMRVQNFNPRFSYEGYDTTDGYCASWTGAMRHLVACGESGVAGARTRQDQLFANAGISFASDPKNAMAAAYPE